MIWFYCEDYSLYSKENIEKLKKEYNLINIIKFPKEENILNVINNEHNLKNTKIGFIAPYYPEKVLKINNNSSFFLIKKIKNKYAPYTEEEYLYGDKKEILSRKLGLKIQKSDFTMKDYVGADNLVNEFKKIELLKKAGFDAKGFLIVGLPGTGKSFFAKCIAGETERLLVELNFAKIMEADRPLEKLDDIFDFLKTINDKLIIWIDEIEKMFKNPASAEIIGRFLTLMNDFNAKGDILFIATANNIVELSRKNPELFRTGGRFDKIIALMPPTNENAKKIFTHYLSKFITKYLYETAVKELFILIHNKNAFSYKNTNIELFLNNFLKVLEQKFQGYYQILKTKKNLKTFSDELKKILNTSSVFKKNYDEYLSNDILTNIFAIQQTFKLEALTKYRAMTVVQERFPYTPAEISSVVREFFINYFFNPFFKYKNYEIALKYSIGTIIPLQAQMKEQISEMYSQAENFLKV